MIQALPELTDPVLPAFGSSTSGSDVNMAMEAPKQAVSGSSFRKNIPSAAPTTDQVYQATAAAIFHRTSFNSKFFPDCLRAPFPAYCQVQYVSVPLTSEQAGHSLKPHMFAFKDSEVNSTYWREACANMTRYLTDDSSTSMRNNTVTTNSSSNKDDDGHGLPERTMHGEVVFAQGGLPMLGPEVNCSFAEGTLPIPVLPVELHSSVVPILQASYKAYSDLRKELNVRRARRLLMPWRSIVHAT
jgi:hypothetical protein